MAKGMTKTALVRALAEKLELTNKQTACFLELLAETAVKETKKNGDHQDQGQDRGQVPRRQGCQGRNRAAEEVVPPPGSD